MPFTKEEVSVLVALGCVRYDTTHYQWSTPRGRLTLNFHKQRNGIYSLMGGVPGDSEKIGDYAAFDSMVARAKAMYVSAISIGY